nr:alpha/beta hydrolase [uncultured Albidiferax sp.]
MLVATNRNINKDNFKNGVGDEKGFGEQQNEKGSNELRFARAEKAGDKWTLALVPEPKDITPETAPSKAEFENVAKQCFTHKKNCVLYTHGYNKPFWETLEQAWLIQERYGVEVVLFSWPSNTGGFPPIEYRAARRIAQASFGALDSLLEKFSLFTKDWAIKQSEKSLLACNTTINFMAHSLGNYLFEHYVLSQAYQEETRLFTNIILSQADVNSNDHTKWVEKLVTGQRIYITINENDKILSLSENVSPPRLGKTLANLVSTKAQYFDFTQGKGVGKKHQLWGEVKNPTVKAFYDSVLNGRRGDDVAGFTYDALLKAYRIKSS